MSSHYHYILGVLYVSTADKISSGSGAELLAICKECDCFSVVFATSVCYL